MQCVHKVHYKNKDMYIYMRPSDNMHYMTYSKGPYQYEWDLNKENHQKLFWIEHGQELRVDCIEDHMKFEKYTKYDIIMNYKTFFKVQYCTMSNIMIIFSYHIKGGCKYGKICSRSNT